MFIAKISKGRTIRQFINGTLSAPVLYSFMWLVVFGGKLLNSMEMIHVPSIGKRGKNVRGDWENIEINAELFESRQSTTVAPVSST